MKKIIVVGNRMDCGGTEIAMLALLKQLVLRDYDITVALKEKSGVLLDQIPTSVNIIALDCMSSAKELLHKKRGIDKVMYFGKRCLDKINGKFHLYDDLLAECTELGGSYDLLIDFFGYGHFLTAFSAKMITAHKKVLWFHDDDLSWMFKIERYLQYYDKLFGVSEAVVAAITNYDIALAEKTDVFYNVIDIEEIRQKSEADFEPIYDSEKLALLTVGRIHEQKGIDILIKTAKILKERQLAFHWYVIGGGETEYYLQMAKQLGVDNCVIFVGQKTNPYPYIKTCDLYIQPSKHEGYGLTILEARVLHKVIIATRLPCIKEQITDGVNGYLVELNPTAFASKIIELANSKYTNNYVMKNLINETIDFTNEFQKLESLFDN